MSATGHGGKRVRDPQATAMARAACVDFIRANPNCRSQDIRAATGLSEGRVRHHLHWCSAYGYIKASGSTRWATWLALETPSKPGAPPLETSQIAYSRTKDDAALDARRRELLSYIRSHGPVTSKQAREAFALSEGIVYDDLRFLREQGCIEPTNDGGPRAWEFVRSLPRPDDPKTQPVVGIKAAHKFCEPGPVITKIEQGIKYTVAAAPKGRFHVDLPPGGGVISSDNHRLAAALSRSA